MMTLAYESKGKGIPLLLIHAFPLSSEMWRQERRVLGAAWRVITPDLPGLGISPCQIKPSIPKMAFELNNFLDGLDIQEPVVLAGLSMGGYVALEFIKQFPKRVRALGLFSTRAEADSPEAREKRLKIVQNIQQEGLEPFAAATVPRLIGKTSQAANPHLIKDITALILKNKSDGVTGALLAMAGRNDSTDVLANIKCPTLIVAGREDEIIPFAVAEILQKKIPGAELHILSKAGHLVNLEQPEEFQTILKDFLKANL